jgi:hypothetical protein
LGSHAGAPGDYIIYADFMPGDEYNSSVIAVLAAAIIASNNVRQHFITRFYGL